jgi:thioredoxin 1
MSSTHLIDLTEATFESIVSKAEIVIIDFWAPWCAPCRAFAPTFEAVAAEHAAANTGIVFAKVNTQDEQGLGAAFNIRSIPTLMVLRQNVIVFEQAGMVNKAVLEQIIAKVMELDMAKVHLEIAQQNQTQQ